MMTMHEVSVIIDALDYFTDTQKQLMKDLVKSTREYGEFLEKKYNIGAKAAEILFSTRLETRLKKDNFLAICDEIFPDDDDELEPYLEKLLEAKEPNPKLKEFFKPGFDYDPEYEKIDEVLNNFAVLFEFFTICKIAEG
jgi:hypothetical protein